ncbi:MAG: heme NO-binding domain-containing protein [Rhodospirillaceae bacterium]
MKGIVFREFLDMVEGEYSADLVDDIIDESDLPSGGAYTAVGTYDHAEMGKLVIALSKRTGANVPDLLKAYGRHLFSRFFAGYPQFFDGIHESFGFLSTIEAFIHVEVKKLYPDAELPSFETLEVSPDYMRMIYRSPRCLGDFAEGLMEGCFEHYKDSVIIKRQDEHDGRIVKFELQKTRHESSP